MGNGHRLFKNLIEPGAIVVAFTVAAVVNRRTRASRGSKKKHDEDATRSPLRPAKSPSPTPCSSDPAKLAPWVWFPDTTPFRQSLLSRFLATFPFLMEIWYWNLTYWVYQLARAYTARKIRPDPAVFDGAFQHAVSVMHLEQLLHLDIEQPLQHFMLRMPAVMTVLAQVYYLHICVGVAFIGYTYTYLPRAVFQRIRRTIAMDNALAFVVLTCWRLTPPRLMPPEFGFVDVLHPKPASGTPAAPTWNNNSYQLTIAAMPSLHFGTALFLAVSIVRFSPHIALRTLAPAWPAAMLLTILATANHWVLDAVVGALVPALGWKLNWVLASPWVQMVEEWAFWVLRAKKPEPDDERSEQSVVGEELI